ncbi:hypothetical protein [Sporolactobacillus shoreae]|uniref:hypothetical protein n=1 Tax=Sporolactobacillus shoreae TaxID=1465501 RepID=UPI0014328D45|nr:hypothetical protein [Sporolactobacillus shoreae]
MENYPSTLKKIVSSTAGKLAVLFVTEGKKTKGVALSKIVPQMDREDAEERRHGYCR